MRERIRSWLLRAGLLEAAVLVSLLIIAGAIWLFLAVADEVLEGDSKAFDESILRALRHPDNPNEPIGPAWLKGVARDFTSLGGVAVISMACIGSVGFLALQRKWHSLILVLVSIGGGALRLWYHAEAQKRGQSSIDLERRRHTFEEVVAGLDPNAARYEAQRCLSCGNCFECDGCFSACPELAVIKLGLGRRYEYDLDKCTGCAICYDQCPCGAITMVSELVATAPADV